MNRHIGINCFLLCVVVALSWGCKRGVDNNTPLSVDEIQISASSTASADWAGKASNNTVPENFDRFSSIGVYTQLLSKVGSTELLPENKANAQFDYATPTWSAHTAADRLRYHDTEKIVVFGYFPHTATKGSRLAATDQPHLFDFWLASDQSTTDSVSLSNLMWCRADNGGQGYLRQGAPISMVFSHLLCKVSVYLRVIDSHPAVGTSPSFVNLRSVTFGPNPNVPTDGQIGVRATFNALGSPTGTGTQALLTPTKWGSVKWTDGGLVELPVPVVAASADPTFVTDFLLLPFTAVQDDNVIRCVLDYPEFNSPNHAFNTRIPIYTGLTFPPAAANGNGWRFGRNDHLKITVTIDVSTSYIGLDATIQPWLSGSNNEIESDRE